MIANEYFRNLPKSFWADVKVIGEVNGYSIRGEIKVPTLIDLINVYNVRSLNAANIVMPDGHPTQHAIQLIEYFQYRKTVLETEVRQNLMNVDEARDLFESLYYQYYDSHRMQCPLPMNKQKGNKKANAYFTCIINMLIELNLNGRLCDYDPRQLSTITINGFPLRTLSRRVDGAYPSTVNPIAIWEIKEYYYTTTFGSRIADSVYETLLDGLELEELLEHQNIKVLHYLMVDAYHTWWDMGKSYLCRMIDILHMGYADEILFGREVVERIPILVQEWIDIQNRNQ